MTSNSTTESTTSTYRHKKYAVLKLISGAEVLGEVVAETATNVSLLNPLQAFYTTSNYGVPSVTVHRFCPFAKEDEFVFCWDHVMTYNELNESSVQYYKDAVKSIRTDRDDNDKMAGLEEVLNKLTKGSVVH